MKKGKLIIISAPSGCGKSTIIGDIMDRGELDLRFSVSATNRKPRPGEVDGVSYHFLSDQEFSDLIAEGAFVEYEQVYPGRYYGTLWSEIRDNIEKVTEKNTEQSQHAREGEKRHLERIIAAGKRQKRKRSHSGNRKNILD